MKHLKYLLFIIGLMPLLIFGQKSQSTFSAGISMRPSMYKNQTQFENQKLFDFAPAVHVEHKINEEFSIKLAVQFRQWEKEFRTERTCLSCSENDRIVNNKFTVLAPAIFISWHKKNNKRFLTATPYVNLGFSQHIQLSSSTANPYSQNEISRTPRVQGVKIEKSSILFGAGMNYPINNKLSFFLEPQVAKPLTGILAWKQYDLGLALGSNFWF